jgi:hypothetical protein
MLPGGLILVGSEHTQAKRRPGVNEKKCKKDINEKPWLGYS